MRAPPPRSLDSDRENEAPGGTAAAAPGGAGEAPRGKPVAKLSTTQVLDLYSNWRAPCCTRTAAAPQLSMPDAAARCAALAYRAASSWRLRTRSLRRTRGRWV
jgi:hypothetical protein